MQVILIIVYVIVGLVILLLLIAAITKKEYQVKREVMINRSKPDIFSFIKFLKNQDDYSKWARMDPAMKKTYQGVDGNPGFTYGWDSEKNDVGKGEQTIKEIREGDYVKYDIHFIRPFEGHAQSVLQTLARSHNETQVNWTFNGKMKFPTNIMLLFMNMNKLVGNDLETGLQNLKHLMEKTKR